MPRNYEIDMCHGPLLRKMCLFAIPLMCSTTLQLLFNATDVIVVGRFAGDNSLAAVGSNSSIINLMLNFFVGLSIGSNVLAARYYGAHNQEDLSKTVHTTMLLSLLCGIVMTIAGVAGARQILIWMQTPKQVLDLAQVCVMVTGLIAGGAAYIFASPLIGIYSRSTDVIAAGTVRLGIVCKTYLLCGIMDVFVGSLRGLGYAMIPMVVSLAGACLFRLIWVATIFQIPQFHKVQILYLSYPISWVLTFIVLGICFVWAFRRTVLHRRITEKTSLSSGSSLK